MQRIITQRSPSLESTLVATSILWPAMKNPPSLLALVLASFFLNPASGQVLIGASDLMKRTVLTLGDVGPKLVDLAPSGDSLNMWNLDMSLYRTLHLPALPPNYSFLTFSYFTRDLFDTDTSTIEFLAMETFTVASRVEVVREDGTVLFTQDPARFANLSGITDPTWNYVFSDGTNTYLHLELTYNAGALLYLLPGHLPCNVCGELFEPNGMAPGTSSSSNAAVFPNPADGSATVLLGDLTGTRATELVLVDGSGRSIKRIAIGPGTERLSITTSDVPSGMYTYYLETDRGIRPGSRFLVVR